MNVSRQNLISLPTWLYYSLSGFCLGVGTVFPWLWWLVIPGVAIFLWTITETKFWTKAFLGGWLAFTIKISFAISYFLTTYPIKWINLSLGQAELPVVVFYWVTVSLAIGLSGGLLAFGLFFVAKRFLSGVYLLAVILFWAPTEILGALFFSLFTYGPGGTINVLYTFGYSGYLLAEQPIIFKLASFGGVFVLSFCASVLGASLYYCFTNYQKYPFLPKLALVLGILFIVTAYLPLTTNHPSSGMKVAIVDTRFGGDDYFALPDRESVRVAQMIEAIAAALNTGADYIVMPEDSRYTPKEFPIEKAYAVFRFQHADTAAVVVDAGRVPISSTEFSLRANIYDGKNKNVYAADKQALVPQGEFMPNFSSGAFKLISLNDSIEKISQTLAYRPGPMADQSYFPSNVPGILFCFSDADPLAVRRLVKERDMPFVAHPISHAWFHSPRSLWFQFDTMLRVQARWNNMAIISAGNMVKGALYTKDGQKVDSEEVSRGDYWTVGLVTL